MQSAKEKASWPDFPQLGRMVVERSVNEASCKPSPGLYVVATPIGNLGDITLRALAILAAADLIACEDTRNSGIMLQAYGIKKPTISYHDHNADDRRPELIAKLREGQTIALISDAGTPAIADPGFKLVRDCREAQIPVTVIPGPSAAITALAASGLPTDQFTFAGFLPPKSAARKKSAQAFKQSSGTVVFYESPQRLAETLSDLAEVLGPNRQAAVARELTKFYEDVRKAPLSELAAHYAENEPKGEIVILIGKSEEPPAALDTEALLTERLKHLSVRDAVAEVAEMTGISKKEIYAKALELEKKQTP